MLRRWLTVLLAVLTALVAASPASASMSLGPQTHVGAFELAAHTLVGPASPRNPGNRWAKPRITYNCASDPLLGVYDMRARWWSPRLGSFLSADQFAYADPNSTLWSWGNQSPTRWSDPSGHCPACIGAYFGGVGGGVVASFSAPVDQGFGAFLAGVGQGAANGAVIGAAFATNPYAGIAALGALTVANENDVPGLLIGAGLGLGQRAPTGGGGGGGGGLGGGGESCPTGGGADPVTLYHGTTASSAARIVANGFRAGPDGVFFAEDYSTAAHFAQEAMAERGATGGTVIKFTVPADVAADMTRGVLGAARGAPTLDILGGSGYEMILHAGEVGGFNAGVQEGTIGVTRLIVGGP